MSLLNARMAPAVLDSGDYNIWEFATVPQVDATVFGTTAEVRYPAAGDTLYVDSISGPGVIQVKFGPHSAWINVYEGTQITHRFNDFWVRDATNYANKTRAYTSARFYTSFGPLIRHDKNTHSLRAGFLSFTGILTAGTKYPLETLGGFGNDSASGKLGRGVIVIKCNSDALANCRVYHGSAATAWGATPAYHLFPGESLSFDFDGKISNMLGTAGAVFSLYVESASNSLSTAVSCIWNPGADLSDPIYCQSQRISAPLDMRG